MNDDLTGKTEAAVHTRSARQWLWVTLRLELAFISMAVLGLAAWMIAEFGEWQLALVICGGLLALIGTVALLGRWFLARR